MRYQTIDTISFTDDFGDNYAIKDMRPIPSDQSILDTVTLRGRERIDEIASRKEYYGDGAESDSYKIVDFNLEKLYEASFDLLQLSILRIPIR